MVDLPVRKNIHISGLSQGSYTVYVYNLDEQHKMTTTISEKNHFISVDDLDAGMYFMKVVSKVNGDSRVFTFLKE